MSKWGQAIDGNYLADQVNDMLGQIGYKAAADTSPWADIELTGATNALAAQEIMDWFTAHNFFDCGAVESIYQKMGDTMQGCCMTIPQPVIHIQQCMIP